MLGAAPSEPRDQRGKQPIHLKPVCFSCSVQWFLILLNCLSLYSYSSLRFLKLFWILYWQAADLQTFCRVSYEKTIVYLWCVMSLMSCIALFTLEEALTDFWLAWEEKYLLSALLGILRLSQTFSMDMPAPTLLVPSWGDGILRIVYLL